MAYIFRERSSYETAPQKAQVEKYNLTLSAKVDPETLTVDDRANEYYQKICKNYVNIKNYFDKIAAEYKNAIKYTKGLEKALNTLSTNCKNQGQYCMNRKNELTSLFEYAGLEKRIADLEAALIQSSME